MNKKQAMVLWITGIICAITLIVAYPRNFASVDDYAINLLSTYIMNVMKAIPAILLVGGILFYALKDRKKRIKKEPARVLVVDDSHKTRELLKVRLNKMGYVVTAVSTGEDALPRLKERAVEFVLLDILMPGKSGLEILGEIKREYPHLPVMMLTSLGYDDKAVKEAIRLGAAGYVSKSSSSEEFKGAISNMLLKR